MTTPLAPAADWYTCAVSLNQRIVPIPTVPALSRTGQRPGGAVGDFIQLRQLARTVVRAHGVPSNCRVEFAAMGQEGCGCAGFDDAPTSFDRPFVLLDKSIYERVERTGLPAVYCGIALHEAGHILHSREMYRRLAAGMSGLRRSYENLWEDERVEELVRVASPGFAGYLQVAKRILLEQGEPGRSLESWAELVDLEVCNTLIFAFIRFPHLIPAPLCEWKAINRECVFESLRALIPAAPRSEADVADFAGHLEALWQRLRKLYPSTAEEARQLVASRELSDDETRRVGEQLVADIEDRCAGRVGMDETGGESSSGAPPSVPQQVNELLAAAIELEALGRSCRQASARQLWRDLADRIVDRAIQIECHRDDSPDRAGRRFAVSDMVRAVERMATVQATLNKREAAALEAESNTEVSHTDSWEWGSTRSTIVVQAHTADELAKRRYEDALDRVRPHVYALRAAFSSFPGKEDTAIERNRHQGTLDARRLVPAVIGGSRDIFKRRIEIPWRGLAIGLLLDESGSMMGSNATTTLDVAVLLAESLRGLPRMELEVYSHTSSEDDSRNCLIRHLCGKQVGDPRVVGSYAAGHMANNYDHQAVLTVTRLFRRATRSARRWLLVVSDGQPAGDGYGGESALAATREAANNTRRQGIRVVNIAIEDYGSEAIFGRDWVLSFTDLPRLVEQFRKLLVRIARAA